MQVEPKQRGTLVPNVGHLLPLRMPPHCLHAPASPAPPVFLRSLQAFELESTRGRCGHTLAAALSRYSAGPCSPLEVLASPPGVLGLSSDVRPMTGVPRKGSLSFYHFCLKTGSLGQLWGDSRFLLSPSIATREVHYKPALDPLALKPL